MFKAEKTVEEMYKGTQKKLASKNGIEVSKIQEKEDEKKTMTKEYYKEEDVNTTIQEEELEKLASKTGEEIKDLHSHLNQDFASNM